MGWSRRRVMSLWSSMNRKKVMDDSGVLESKLARVLTTFDLIGLGVGSTLGVGIYVLAGGVAKTLAGPGVVISFFFAAIASALAGLCFAEFGARVPKAGSAYIYSYYCVGEVVAFVIGWNLILEYLIGSASVARGISTYIDSLANGDIKTSFINVAPLPGGFFSEYVDFFSFGLCILLSLALAFGVKESTMINNIFTICNVGVVTFIIVTGIFKADPHNWALTKEEVAHAEVDAGEGGFLPFGLSGVFKGAAVCFYGFVGFDCIATTGEEVKNPQKAIPVAIITAMATIFICYFGVSTVLTLMVPYFMQDVDAPIPFAYDFVGWPAVRWVVAIGSLFGLFASLFGAMYPLPRIIYAMASDGLLFPVLGHVNPKFHTPLLGTLLAGFCTAVMTAFFSLQQLVNLMAIGTLTAYTIVSMCVLILRYGLVVGAHPVSVPDPDPLLQDTPLSDRFSPPEEGDEDEASKSKERGAPQFEESTNLVTLKTRIRLQDIALGYLRRQSSEPSRVTKRIVAINICLFSILSVALGLVFLYLEDELAAGSAVAVAPVAVIVALLLVIVLSIHIQPRAVCDLSFKMPLVPLLPCISILINIYLMVMLDGHTWIRFAVWLAIGIIPYLLWYIWKRRKGNAGLNSTYEIRRINTKRLNDMSARLYSQKRTKLSGKLNSAYIRDDHDLRPELQYAIEEMDLEMELQDATEWTPKQLKWFTEDENNNEEEVEELETAVIHKAPPIDQLESANIDIFINESYNFLTEIPDKSPDDLVTELKQEMINKDSVVNDYVRSFSHVEHTTTVNGEASSLEEQGNKSARELVKETVQEKGSEDVKEFTEPQNNAVSTLYTDERASENKKMSDENDRIARRQRKISNNEEQLLPPINVEESQSNKTNVAVEGSSLVQDIQASVDKLNGSSGKSEKVNSTNDLSSEVNRTDYEQSRPERKSRVTDKYLQSIGADIEQELVKTSVDSEGIHEPVSTPVVQQSTRQSALTKYEEAVRADNNPDAKAPVKRINSKPILVLENETKQPPPPPPPPPLAKKPVVKQRNEESREKKPDIPKRLSRSNSKLADMYIQKIKETEGPVRAETGNLNTDLLAQIRSRPVLKHVDRSQDERGKIEAAKESATETDNSMTTLKNRLTRLLQAQFAFQQTSQQKPSSIELTEEEVEASTDSKAKLDEEALDRYQTIKTLSKSAMRGRLENILAKGPPKRPSFRNSFDTDATRQDKVNAIREIEQQALKEKEQENIEIEEEKKEIQEEANVEPRREKGETPAQTDEDKMARKQKMLMGDVLRTIKLKGTLSKGAFYDDF